LAAFACACRDLPSGHGLFAFGDNVFAARLTAASPHASPAAPTTATTTGGDGGGAASSSAAPPTAKRSYREYPEVLSRHDPGRPVLLLQLCDAAKQQQHTSLGLESSGFGGARGLEGGPEQLLRRLAAMATHVRCYEDASLQSAARALVPWSTVEG
jgi:hypothetical protein